MNEDFRFGVSLDVLKERGLTPTDDSVRYLTPLPTFISDPDPKCVFELRITDVETTGVDRENDEIISLSYIKARFDDDLKKIVVYEMDTLYNQPSIPIPEIITDLTGITDAMVEGHHISRNDVYDIFCDADMIAAHNASFDRAFLDRYGCPDMRKDEDGESEQAIVWLCTYKDIDIKNKYGCSTSSLAAVMAQAFGYYMDHHESMADTWGCFHLLADNFEDVVNSAYEVKYTIYAIRAPFESKDKLKGRNYRWNPTGKVWYKENLTHKECSEELSFMEKEIPSCEPEVVEIPLSHRFRQFD